MTVRDFALCAHEPEELNVCIGSEEYSLIGENTGKIDKLLLSAFGDYLVKDFHATETKKYTVWVKEVPIKAVRA